MKKKRLFIMVNVIVIISLMIVYGIIFYQEFYKDRKYEMSRDISEIFKIRTLNVLNIDDVNIHVEKVEKKLESLESYECCVKLSMLEVKTAEVKQKVYDKDFTEDDKYLLAKIAMAEAEGQDIKTKTLVIMSILNRVESEDFPDSISEVIFQNNGKTYQYSPIMQGGRWWDVEPNDDCYKAVDLVLNVEYDYSENTLYFESCEGDSWHNRNLTYLYKSGDLRFYR